MRLIDADVAQAIADRELSADGSEMVQFILSHTPTVDIEVTKNEYVDIHSISHWRWVKEPTQWMCPKCGYMFNPDDFHFCPFCGYGDKKYERYD